MIDGIEKLPNVALQRITASSVIAADSPEHLCHFLHAFVRTLADAAGKRFGNERRLEDRIQNAENRMMEHAITNDRFVNPPNLRIVYPESLVRSVFVGSVLEIAVQTEDIRLQVKLEFRHVRLVPFIRLKNFPCPEQGLGRNYPPI